MKKLKPLEPLADPKAQSKTKAKPKTTKKKTKTKIDEKTLVLNTVMTDQEAIDAKMKVLESKIFGIFSPVKYKLISKQKVYVPYELIVFHYEINKNEKKAAQGKKGKFDRYGEIAVVYDLNEEHTFHFDLLDIDQLDTKEVENLNEKNVLPSKCSKEETVKRCEEVVRWKMLSRVFRASGEIDVVERRRFYRQAWEMTVECRGKTFIKYAYLDTFTSSNEHISGLKVRLEV